MLLSIEPDAPAALAGLLVGDVIIGIDSQSVENLDPLLAFLAGDVVAKNVPVDVVRGGVRTKAEGADRGAAAAGTMSAAPVVTLLTPVAELLRRSVVQILSGPGVGAGVVWGPGLVVMRRQGRIPHECSGVRGGS